MRQKCVKYRLHKTNRSFLDPKTLQLSQFWTWLHRKIEATLSSQTAQITKRSWKKSLTAIIRPSSLISSLTSRSSLNYCPSVRNSARWNRKGMKGDGCISIAVPPGPSSTQTLLSNLSCSKSHLNQARAQLDLATNCPMSGLVFFLRTTMLLLSSLERRQGVLELSLHLILSRADTTGLSHDSGTYFNVSSLWRVHSR
jgi:hypothetical protein